MIEKILGERFGSATYIRPTKYCGIHRCLRGSLKCALVKELCVGGELFDRIVIAQPECYSERAVACDLLVYVTICLYI